MNNMNEELKTLCINLFEANTLKFGQFKLKSGTIVNAYFELTIILSYPHLMNTICDLICNLIAENGVISEGICGVSYSGIPFAALLSFKLKLPLFLRRKEKVLCMNDGKIDGNIIKRNKCLVVEEVVCSGTSTLQVIKDIEYEGMVVTDVVLIVDLEQGGVENLSRLGYKVHTLCKLSEMGNILYENGKIKENQLEDIRNGWREIFAINGDCVTGTTLGLRRTLTYEARIGHLKSQISVKLFTIIMKKKTNLCIDIKTANLNLIIQTAELIGPHICILILHLNAVDKLNNDLMSKLKQIAMDYNFLIMDDGKLSEDGYVLREQLKRLLNFVDLVTVLPLCGESTIKEVKSVMNNYPDKGVFLLGSTDTEDALLGSGYEKDIIKLTLSHFENVCGFIFHHNSQIPVGYVHIMPDMRNSGSVIKKIENTNYYTPEIIINNLAADVTILSYDNSMTKEIMQQRQNLLWNAYLKRFDETCSNVSSNIVTNK